MCLKLRYHDIMSEWPAEQRADLLHSAHYAGVLGGFFQNTDLEEEKKRIDEKKKRILNILGGSVEKFKVILQILINIPQLLKDQKERQKQLCAHESKVSEGDLKNIVRNLGSDQKYKITLIDGTQYKSCTIDGHNFKPKSDGVNVIPLDKIKKIEPVEYNDAEGLAKLEIAQKINEKDDQLIVLQARDFSNVDPLKMFRSDVAAMQHAVKVARSHGIVISTIFPDKDVSHDDNKSSETEALRLLFGSTFCHDICDYDSNSDCLQVAREKSITRTRRNRQVEKNEEHREAEQKYEEQNDEEEQKEAGQREAEIVFMNQEQNDEEEQKEAGQREAEIVFMNQAFDKVFDKYISKVNAPLSATFTFSRGADTLKLNFVKIESIISELKRLLQYEKGVASSKDFPHCSLMYGLSWINVDVAKLDFRKYKLLDLEEDKKNAFLRRVVDNDGKRFIRFTLGEWKLAGLRETIVKETSYIKLGKDYFIPGA